MLRTAAGYFNVGDVILFGRWKNKRGIIKSLYTDQRGVPMVEIEPVPKGRKQNKTFSLFKIWHAAPPAQETQVMSSIALRVAAKFQAGTADTSLSERVAARFQVSAAKSRKELVEEYKHLSKLLADETQPESEARPIRKKREKVQEEIDALDEKSKKTAALGETTERDNVRIHQYMDHFRVWDLTNAGKRGKTVRVMVIAPNIRGNGNAWVERMGELVMVHYDSYDDIKATFMDMLHDKPGEIRITEDTVRGVDVVPANVRKLQLKWTVKDKKMELTATPLDFTIKDSWEITKDGKSVGWQDTLTYPAGKSDAKVFYSWAAANEDALKKLDISGLKKVMMELKIRFDSH